MPVHKKSSKYTWESDYFSPKREYDYKNKQGYSKQMVDAMNSLLDKSRIRDTKKHLKPVKDRVPKTADTGKSKLQPGRIAAGIASPLTENDASTRTFYATVGELTSTDGMIIMELVGINTIDFVDAGGNPVQLDFDDPNA